MKEKILKSNMLYTFLSILIGFLVGAILLQIIGVSSLKAYGKLVQGVFGKPKFMFYSLVYAAPLVFTGLSVAFSFRTGIFNIGAEGQFVVGSLAAVVIGILCPMPAPLHAIVCILAAAAAGAFWGFLVGLLKVKKGINEVLSYIMFNWIAFYLSNFVVNLKAIHTEQGAEATRNILESASLKIPASWVPFAGGADIHWGLILAVVVAVIIWFIMAKTTFGYQLRAVGDFRYSCSHGRCSADTWYGRASFHLCRTGGIWLPGDYRSPDWCHESNRLHLFRHLLWRHEVRRKQTDYRRCSRGSSQYHYVLYHHFHCDYTGFQKAFRKYFKEQEGREPC